jgi:hypothetical protein
MRLSFKGFREEVQTPRKITFRVERKKNGISLVINASFPEHFKKTSYRMDCFDSMERVQKAKEAINYLVSLETTLEDCLERLESIERQDWSNL